MKKIMYLTTVNSTFILRDIEMLKEHNEVFHLWRSMNNSFKGACNFIIYHIRFLINFWKYDVIISRFVGYHTLFPFYISRIFGKKTIAILGGTACHLFPELKYGSLLKFPFSAFTYYSIKAVDLLLPVHKSLLFYKYTYAETTYSNQGIFGLRPKLSNKKYEVIYNGFDFNKFQNYNFEREEKSFITIVSNLNRVNYKLKGIDLIIELARKRTDLNFYIIGSINFKFDKPLNVIFLGRMDQNELVQALNTKQFYMQLSMAEGFPNALCESMLCGCIPIGSDVFSMSEIIGNTGIILKSKNSDLLSNEIDNLLKIDLARLQKLARAKVREDYPLDRRKLKFNEMLDRI